MFFKKHCLLLIFILLSSNNLLFSQATTLLSQELKISKSKQAYLDSLNILKLDSNFIYSIIPSTHTEVSKTLLSQHFPYPILFVHGLLSSADTWLTFYNYALSHGWSYGGQPRFCLNSDNDFSFANITNPLIYDIKDYTPTLASGDFYLINFNTDSDGTVYGGNYNTLSQSNQAAVKKQGLAIKEAISKILLATGKDKVILVTHSMGGLASREYLQNTNNWQADSSHHVAKLVTIGTPHGGSNISGSSMSTFFTGIDESSDAIRDLRRSYFYSSTPGTFLFGGFEKPSNMNDNIFGFYNYDVTCNGIDSEIVVGINQKPIPNDLDFSAVIGDWSLDLFGPGDGAVNCVQAQPKNYLLISSETFTLPVKHTSLNDETKTVFEAFDEPDELFLAYGIKENKIYNGFLSIQASDGMYYNDYDTYKFIALTSGSINIAFGNLSIPNTMIRIYDAKTLNLIYNHTVSSLTFLTPNLWLNNGEYYIEISGLGNLTSWQYPYNFKINTLTIPSSIEELTKINTLLVYPNPASNSIKLSLQHFDNTFVSIEIYNQLGEIVKELSNFNLNDFMQLNDISNGIYYIVVYNNKEVLGKLKFVKNDN